MTAGARGGTAAWGPSSTPCEGLVDGLGRAVLDAPADAAVATVVAWTASWSGGRVAVRLADRAGRLLHDAEGVAETWPLDVGEAAAALWSREVHREDADGSERVHVPIAARGTALGVLTVDGPAVEVDDRVWRALGEAVALLLGQAGQVCDAWEIRRRSASFSVSAELQWQLLPPTSVVTPGVELHALIEPAPRVSSDLFDWSLDDGRLWLAVLDAEGRSLSASLPAALALAALRHARRLDLPLGEQVGLADEAVYDQFRGHAAVRAVVAVLDVATGTAEMVRAGTGGSAPRAFRRRGGEVVELDLTEHEDLGRFDRSHYRADPADLGAGDDLLVVTDGGPEARGDGETFGAASVVEHFAAMATPAAHPRCLLDAVRAHHGGDLLQDATALVVALT